MGEADIRGFGSDLSRTETTGVGVHATPSVLIVDETDDHTVGLAAPAREANGVAVVAHSRFPSGKRNHKSAGANLSRPTRRERGEQSHYSMDTGAVVISWNSNENSANYFSSFPN